jgi:glucokinase
MAKTRVGVDLGGTSVKVGAVVDGAIVARRTVMPGASLAECMHDIAEAVRAVSAEAAGIDPADGAAADALPEALGIGLPGVCDEAQRVVLDAPNIPFLEGQDVAGAAEAELGIAVRLENDANVAALGEARFGSGEDFPDFLLATLGTGIGGGLILDGRIWRGPGGMAGEFGHMNVGHDRRCGCGAMGCIEAAASAVQMERRGSEALGRDLKLPDLAAMAREGDAQARAVFDEAGALFGEALAQVALLLDLRVFLVGGGGAPVLDLLHAPAVQVLGLRAFGRSADDFVLVPATLGNDAGILGAALL